MKESMMKVEASAEEWNRSIGLNMKKKGDNLIGDKDMVWCVRRRKSELSQRKKRKTKKGKKDARKRKKVR